MIVLPYNVPSCSNFYRKLSELEQKNRFPYNSGMQCRLYNTIIQSINENYLLLTDVPKFVDMNNITFHLQYSDSSSGALCMTVKNCPFVMLENELNEIFYSLSIKVVY